MSRRVRLDEIAAGDRVRLLHDWRYEGHSDLIPEGSVLLVVEAKIIDERWVHLTTVEGNVVALDREGLVTLEED